MADSTIEMEARLKNHISGELGKISGDVKKMSDTTKKGMGEASKAASAFQGIIAKFAVAQLAVQGINMAFGALRRTMSDSIGAYRTQVQANQALTAALGYTNESLFAYSAELQKVTTYGDEQITQAQAVIAAFVKDEEQIKKLTKASLDLAAAKGMDLRSAADLLTKSVASETNALARYGIQIEGAAGSTERMQNAVDKVSGAFGGMAEALSQTDAGQLQQIENKIGDISESLGQELMPYLLVWKEIQQDILGFVTKVAGVFGIVMENQGKVMEEKTREWYEAEKARIEELIEMRRKGIEDSVISFTGAGGFGVDESGLEELESRLRQINTIMGRMGGTPTAPEVDMRGDPAQKQEDAAQREIDMMNEVARVAQENWEARRKIEQNKTDDLLAQIEERIAAEQNMLAIESEIEQAKAEMRQLDIDMAKAQAQAMEEIYDSATSAILSIMSAFVEDERAIAYTRAILGSAQALSGLISLAVEESNSWYEALAKGIASAAEVVALWAPIFADISSAATGGKFVTNGPTMMGNTLVGDNPGGREEVTVRPVSSANTSGTAGSASYVFNFSGVNEDQFMRMMRRLERTGKIERVTAVGSV